MASSSCVDDRDVAKYVLAYLMEKNYSHTTAAFLQECECLQQTSSDNIMILPKVPLKVLINEHTARQNTGVMVKTLGAQQAWKSLWSKLQLTMEEISSLAQESMTVSQPLLLSSSSNRSNSKRNTLFIKTTKSRKTSVSNAITTSSSATPTIITNVSLQSPLSPHVSPTSPIIPIQTTTGTAALPPSSPLVTPQFNQLLNLPPSADGKSPRKKRVQPPKRKEIHVSPGNAESPTHSIDQPEDVQQLLSSLMSNEELPWRLAELINRHVGGGINNMTTAVGSPELAQTSTLLTATSTDTTSTSGTVTDTNSNQWLDDLINSVFPAPDNNQVPKTLPQEVHSDGISAPGVTCESYVSLPPSVEDHTHKRPLLSEEGDEKLSKRLRPDLIDEGPSISPSQRPIPVPINEGPSSTFRLRLNPILEGSSTSPSQRPIPDPMIEEFDSTSSSSLKLPDGVSLEHFLDQIHK